MDCVPTLLVYLRKSLFKSPPSGNLPTHHFEDSTPFKIIGVDYTGTNMYKEGNSKEEKKAYILLLTCSLTRAVHLELVIDRSVDKFIPAIKRFTVRQRPPKKIYSDNAKTL